jgi:hypothetical protein
MYLIEEWKGSDARLQVDSRNLWQPSKRASGHFPTTETRDKVETLRLWGSSFFDPGEDFTRWVGLDSEGIPLFEITEPGY